MDDRARRPPLGRHRDDEGRLGSVAVLEELQEVEPARRVAVGRQQPGGVAELLDPVRVEVLEVRPQRMARRCLGAARPVERLRRQARRARRASPSRRRSSARGSRPRSGSPLARARRPRPGTPSGLALVSRRRQLHSTSSSWTSVARRPSRPSGAVPGQVTPGVLGGVEDAVPDPVQMVEDERDLGGLHGEVSTTGGRCRASQPDGVLPRRVRCATS